MTYDGTCDYCLEISAASPNTRFATTYGDALTTRIVRLSAYAAVMPTIGQIFDGSMLVVPRAHIPTIAALETEIRSNVLQLVTDEIAIGGEHVVAFEHGAYPHTGGSCGIYHAHMHVVPVPSRVALSDMLPDAHRVDDLGRALLQTPRADEYLIFRDTTGAVGYITSVDKRAYPSQYFRRALQEYFRRDRPWDWHEYTGREPALVDVVRRRTRAPHVSDSDNRLDSGRHRDDVATRVG